MVKPPPSRRADEAAAHPVGVLPYKRRLLFELTKSTIRGLDLEAQPWFRLRGVARSGRRGPTDNRVESNPSRVRIPPPAQRSLNPGAHFCDGLPTVSLVSSDQLWVAQGFQGRETRS